MIEALMVKVSRNHTRERERKVAVADLTRFIDEVRYLNLLVWS